MSTAKIQLESIAYEEVAGDGPSLRWRFLDGIAPIVEQYIVHISDSQKYGTQNYNIIYEPITHTNLQC